MYTETNKVHNDDDDDDEERKKPLWEDVIIGSVQEDKIVLGEKWYRTKFVLYKIFFLVLIFS